MIIINFSHPLTNSQLEDIRSITSNEIQRVVDVPVQFESQLPFVPQLKKLLQEIPISPDEFQQERLLIVPPALNFITALLLAELHGRMGYFPSIIRLRLANDSLPSFYEVAEILNLNEVREASRKRRFEDE